MTEPEEHRGVLAPSRYDPVARAASEVIGGPAGTRVAANSGFVLWRAIPVLIMLAMAMLAFGVVEKQHCRVEGWNTPDQFWHACYSDIPLMYSAGRLGESPSPSIGQAVDRLGSPPLTGAAMWVVSHLVPDRSPELQGRWFFDLSTLALGLCLSLAVVATGLAAGRRRWDAAHVALSPMLVTSALISYDLLAVMLLAFALLGWAKRWWLWSGLLLGLSMGVRPALTLVLLAALAVLLAARRWGEAVQVAAAAVGVWLVLRLALLPMTANSGFAGLEEAWRNWRHTGAGYGSIWLVPNLIGQSKPRQFSWWYSGPGPSPTVTSVLIGIGFALLLAAIAYLVLTSGPRVPLAPVALFGVAGALLLAKQFPPQASLVLLPLIALAGLRWRDHLIWVVPELVYFVGIWMYIAAGHDQSRGLPARIYVIILLVRVAAVAWIAHRAWVTAREAGAAALDGVPVDGAAGDPYGAASVDDRAAASAHEPDAVTAPGADRPDSPDVDRADPPAQVGTV